MQLAGRRNVFVRTRTRRVLLVVVTLLLVAGVWAGSYAYHVYVGLHKITDIQVPRAKLEPTFSIPPINSDQRLNVLVLGSDNDKKREEKHPLTQSMIIVSIDPRNYKVSMLSIPRDFWVPIPGHGWGKIDLAHKFGGVQLARETVERLFHVNIDYYAWVGLSGFRRVIDTFGGVSLDVSHPVLDDFYPNDTSSGSPYAYTRVFIPEGWRHLSGRQALQYVRSRHGDQVGDFGRSSRQQQILAQLRQKLNALNVLRHLSDLVDELNGYVQTDLSPVQLYQLQELSRHIASQNVKRLFLPAPTYCNYSFTRDGQSILVPHWNKILPVVRAMTAPIRATVPRPTAPAPTAAPRVAARVTPTPARSPTPSKATATPAPTSTPVLAELPARLIFIRDGNVALMSRNGSVSNLTSTAGLSMPAVSPDGRLFAFVRWRAYSSDIEVAELRPAQRSPVPAGRTLTYDESTNVHNNLWAVWPAWQADGRELLFSTDRAKLGVTPSEARPLDLAVWFMPVSGKPLTRLTTPNQLTGGDTEPVAEPGTSKFLYVQWNFDTARNKPFSQLVLTDPAHHTFSWLTPRGTRIFQPQFDRSGSHLIYVRDNGASDEVDITRVVASHGATRLVGQRTLVAGKVTQPAFTPDGRWVSYLEADGDGFSLYLVPSNGGTPVRVEPAGSNMDATSRPIWIP